MNALVHIERSSDEVVLKVIPFGVAVVQLIRTIRPGRGMSSGRVMILILRMLVVPRRGVGRRGEAAFARVVLRVDGVESLGRGLETDERSIHGRGRRSVAVIATVVRPLLLLLMKGWAVVSVVVSISRLLRMPLVRIAGGGRLSIVIVSGRWRWMLRLLLMIRR